MNRAPRGFRCLLLLSLVVFGVGEFGPVQLVAQLTPGYEKARLKMVQDFVIGAGVRDPRVVRAMSEVPRHEFVDAAHRSKAYLAMALPIGEQQTISSPLIVSYMTQSLDPQPTDRVLEIGTGSGYQAAVLSPLVQEVYTIEIVESLGTKAAKTLKRLKFANVFTRIGDGYKGWAEHAPFDKIIVTCSPEKVPQPLVDQLKDGGLMVIPVGERYQQTLYLFRKQGGQLEAEALLPTLFVPMTGQAEANRQIKPDPKRPVAINGDFELPADEKGFLAGWYYQRQATWEEDASAPRGPHIVTFRNDEPGQSAHALQGFAIDGRFVPELELSAWVRARQATKGNRSDDAAAVAVTLYDEQRKELDVRWIGPFTGTFDWKEETLTIRVPPKTREGILRMGLFGATGEVSFDGVQIRPVKKPE